MDVDDRLLAYIQGHLDDTNKAAFEAELAIKPELRAELAAMRAAAHVMGEERPNGAVKDKGWARLSQSMEGARFGKPANDNRRPSFFHAAGIAAAAVLVWQFAAVPLLTEPERAVFLPASEATIGPALHVAFVETARLSDVTSVLNAAGAQIIDGPGATGIFKLIFADEDARRDAEAAFEARPELFVIVSRP